MVCKRVRGLRKGSEKRSEGVVGVGVRGLRMEGGFRKGLYSRL